MLDGNEQPVDDSVNAQDFISSIQGDVETTPEIETPEKIGEFETESYFCLLYTSPSPRDGLLSRMPSSA